MGYLNGAWLHQVAGTKVPRCVHLRAGVQLGVAQDDRVLGVAPLGQLVAAGVGVAIPVVNPSAVLG